jgi:peptidoglycan/xylan/chitin deacetylase (PgdA/CDA1 family)
VRGLEWCARKLALPALKMRARLPPRWLTILMYHRVSARPGPDFELDEAVVDSDPEGFDQHMGLVASTCTPIDLAQLLRFLDGESQLPPNPVLVTFDDGYLDNRTNALPILLRHGIRAVFFVSSHYVGQRKTFWWDRLAYLVYHAPVSVARMSYPTDLVLRVGENRELVARLAARIIKNCRGLDVEKFLDRLGHALGVDWDDELDRRLADRTIMTWDDVRALHAAGMAIGSHTRTHRVLDTVAAEELAGELAQSRADIERAIGAPVISVAYPVGRPVRRLLFLEREVRRAGYEVGFSVEDRSNPLATAPHDRLNLTRRAMNADISRDRLAALLAGPELVGAM